MKIELDSNHLGKEIKNLIIIPLVAYQLENKTDPDKAIQFAKDLEAFLNWIDEN